MAIQPAEMVIEAGKSSFCLGIDCVYWFTNLDWGKIVSFRLGNLNWQMEHG
jgi:hypothetical protein